MQIITATQAHEMATFVNQTRLAEELAWLQREIRAAAKMGKFGLNTECQNPWTLEQLTYLKELGYDVSVIDNFIELSWDIQI